MLYKIKQQTTTLGKKITCRLVLNNGSLIFNNIIASIDMFIKQGLQDGMGDISLFVRNYQPK
jgi:hypothetical protein